MKFAWHADNFWGVGSRRELLGGLVSEKVSHLNGTCFATSSKWLPFYTYKAYFRQLRARCQHIVAFHYSDEWFLRKMKRSARRLRNRSPVLYEPLRLAELVGHQSNSSLRCRLADPFGPLQRILRDGLCRVCG